MSSDHGLVTDASVRNIQKMTKSLNNKMGGGGWTEQKRLILIEAVMKFEEESQRDGATPTTNREKWAIIRTEVCSRLDLLNESAKSLGSHAMMAHFFHLLRLVELESEATNAMLTPHIRSKLKDYKDKKFGFKTRWTEETRLRLIEVVTIVERQRLETGLSRTGKWKIIAKQLNGFSPNLRSRSAKQFVYLYRTYHRLKKDKSLMSISFPYQKKLTERIYAKLGEYDLLVNPLDGEALKLTNPTEESSERESLSDDDVDVDVDVDIDESDQSSEKICQSKDDDDDDVDAYVDIDDDQLTSLSPPLSGFKDCRLPAVPPGVLDSRDSLDTLVPDALDSHRVSLDEFEAKGVQPDTLLPCRGVKRSRENEILTMHRGCLEGVLDTWLERKGNAKAYLEIVLSGLLEEKVIVKKVREMAQDPSMRGRVSEFTSVDQRIQALALEQMQLTVEAMYESMKMQMTQMVEQTNKDLMCMVVKFADSLMATFQ